MLWILITLMNAYTDWDTKTNNAVWITVTGIVVIVINFLGTRAFGECEFWFASIKVITIIGLIILGLVIDLGGAPTHDRLGFRYWVRFTWCPGIPARKITEFASCSMTPALSFNTRVSLVLWAVSPVSGLS
jgi:amino acid permease